MFDRRIDMFLVVADQLSFSKAADLLNISQPSLSRSIQSLEAEIGFRLFVRSKSKICLSPAGLFLKDEFRFLKDRYQASLSQAASLQSGFSGQIRIGISRGQSLSSVHEILDRYRRLHPDIAFFLKSEDLGTLRTMLDTHLLDFVVGLSGDFSFTSRFSSKAVKDVSFFMGVSENHRLADREDDGTLSLDDFRDDTFVLLSESETPTVRALIRCCNKVGFWPKTVEVPDLLSVALWVESGQAVAAFPEIAIAYSNPALRFFRLREIDFSAKLVVVWATDDDNPVNQAFIRYLNDTFPGK